MIAETLQQLETVEARLLPLKQLSAHPAFQPRNERIVPLRHRAQVEQRSSAQVDSLRLRLESSQLEQLDPIWAIKISTSGNPEVPDGLYVVDGHHRLTAYRLAKRKSIPVCACSSDYRTAVLISKRVNCTHRALEMHPEQKRDAAWQYLAAVTQQGAIELRELSGGEALRSVGSRFGVSKNTIASMLKHLKDVDVSEYNSSAIDPGTGFPRWRCVREHKSPWKQMLDASDEVERTQYKAVKLARAVIALRNEYSHEERLLAFGMLKAEDEHTAHEIGEGTVDLFIEIVRDQGTDIDYLLSL